MSGPFILIRGARRVGANPPQLGSHGRAGGRQEGWRLAGCRRSFIYLRQRLSWSRAFGSQMPARPCWDGHLSPVPFCPNNSISRTTSPLRNPIQKPAQAATPHYFCLFQAVVVCMEKCRSLLPPANAFPLPPMAALLPASAFPKIFTFFFPAVWPVRRTKNDQTTQAAWCTRALPLLSLYQLGKCILQSV